MQAEVERRRFDSTPREGGSGGGVSLRDEHERRAGRMGGAEGLEGVEGGAVRGWKWK